MKRIFTLKYVKQKIHYWLLRKIPILSGVGPVHILNRIFRNKNFSFLSIFLLKILLKILSKKSNYFIFYNSLNELINKKVFPKSQMLQDVFVFAFYKEIIKQKFYSSNIFLVCEIGAAHPEKYSNSNLLIANGAEGILIEPNPIFAKNLRQYYENTNTKIVEKAISTNSGKSNLISASFLSALESKDIFDQYSILREKISEGNVICVKTLNPVSFVNEFKIPNLFLYLSIDAEGMDYHILEQWPFSISRPILISIEHNFNPDLQKKIKNLLVNLRYELILERISSIDYFFIHNEFKIN